jgi:hypothetical protein
MFVEGVDFGDSINTCYIPIFHNNGKSDDNTWYLGNLFMHKYYIILDMTPREELNLDFI